VKAFAIWFAVGFVGAGTYFGSAIVGMVAGVILYLVTVQVWPWTLCHACEGIPRRHRDWGEAAHWRTCGACKGTGKEPRALAHPSRVQW
jgi:hypothetical protein